MRTTWISETQLAARTKLPVDVLRTGLESGLFEGWTRTVNGKVQFKPGTVRLVEWSSRLTDALLEGHITYEEAARLLWRRARRETLAAS